MYLSKYNLMMQNPSLLGSDKIIKGDQKEFGITVTVKRILFTRLKGETKNESG